MPCGGTWMHTYKLYEDPSNQVRYKEFWIWIWILLHKKYEMVAIIPIALNGNDCPNVASEHGGVKHTRFS